MLLRASPLSLYNWLDISPVLLFVLYNFLILFINFLAFKVKSFTLTYLTRILKT